MRDEGAGKDFDEAALMIDGACRGARFSRRATRDVFVPLILRLTDLYREKGRRVVAFLGAAPGAGKSMLAAYLEKLSRQTPGAEPISALGLDGFHYDGAHIDQSFVTREGVTYPMRQVKGWAETFDAEKLCGKLEQIRAGGRVLCPRYDRTLHDPVEDAVPVEGSVVLVEGMWMLHADGPWARVQAMGDYKILLLAEIPLLRARYVARKMLGGWDYERALSYFNRTDCRAIRRIVLEAVPADLYLETLPDDDIVDLGGRPAGLERFYVG